MLYDWQRAKIIEMNAKGVDKADIAARFSITIGTVLATLEMEKWAIETITSSTNLGDIAIAHVWLTKRKYKTGTNWHYQGETS